MVIISDTKTHRLCTISSVIFSVIHWKSNRSKMILNEMNRKNKTKTKVNTKRIKRQKNWMKQNSWHGFILIFVPCPLPPNNLIITYSILEFGTFTPFGYSSIQLYDDAFSIEMIYFLSIFLLFFSEELRSNPFKLNRDVWNQRYLSVSLFPRFYTFFLFSHILVLHRIDSGSKRTWSFWAPDTVIISFHNLWMPAAQSLASSYSLDA